MRFRSVEWYWHCLATVVCDGHNHRKRNFVQDTTFRRWNGRKSSNRRSINELVADLYKIYSEMNILNNFNSTIRNYLPEPRDSWFRVYSIFHASWQWDLNRSKSSHKMRLFLCFWKLARKEIWMRPVVRQTYRRNQRI